VEVGARVDADDTIGIVEVMKLMQQVPAGVSGVVTAIPVGNAETVAFNQPLVFIDPTG
jgi:acetyl-CoA carboxylase biotin carboxyl carrier protein